MYYVLFAKGHNKNGAIRKNVHKLPEENTTTKLTEIYVGKNLAAMKKTEENRTKFLKEKIQPAMALIYD